jgi:hypothetical protein
MGKNTSKKNEQKLRLYLATQQTIKQNAVIKPGNKKG